MDNNSSAFGNVPHNKQSLQEKYGLSFEDVDSILISCGLAVDQHEYSHDDINNSFEPAVKTFQSQKDSQSSSSTQSKPSIKPKKAAVNLFEPESKCTSIIELKSMASEWLNAKISLSQMLQIIEACGLSEKDEYTPFECERVEALIKNQGEPIDLKSTISNTTTASEAGLAYLVDKITDNLASKAPGFINQMYLQKVSDKLAQSQDEIRDFYVELEETILAELSGKKSPLEAMLEARTHKNLLPLSLMKSAELAPESKNDTTTT
ncbi:hypothetical protein WKK05_40625 (plasmid) [Nostoc sp. UHCC 0302]|uniref:hypothetical protein n=1 Tax=Nostoc sp. UHCC 0302 TaxID=3134896 RepID=UPI00311C915F